jgi:hypothetical protein
MGECVWCGREYRERERGQRWCGARCREAWEFATAVDALRSQGALVATVVPSAVLERLMEGDVSCV